jgi:hypothetical protein
MKKIKLLMVAAISAVCLNSCSKGDTGPAGPTGATGNANVAIGNFTVPSTDWVVDGSDAYQIDCTVNITSGPDLTSGACMAYVSADDVNWTALPYSYESGGVQYSWNYTFNSTSLIMYIQNTTPFSTTVPGAYATTYLKLVVIPPAVMKQHPNVDWKNYNTVQAIMKSNK